MIRSLYPIDLISLLLLPPKSPNQAKTRDGLERRSLLSPRALLEHWLPLRGRRYTWVSSQQGRIQSLISVRSCSGPAAWQIDHLQASDGERCLALLDRVSAFAARQGARRIFLRLPADSPLIDGARRAGFSPYGLDFLYRHPGDIGRVAVTFPQPYSLRPRSEDDDYPLFELYSAAVPISVRTAEGMALEEWRESRDRCLGLKQRELVLDKEGSVVGWLRIGAAGRVGFFEVMGHPSEEARLEMLVTWALACLSGKSPLFCIASAFQGQLLGLLGRHGFEEVAQHSALVKETALRVKEPHYAAAEVR